MNILVNTALAHWLAQKGALKLRWRRLDEVVAFSDGIW